MGTIDILIKREMQKDIICFCISTLMLCLELICKLLCHLSEAECSKGSQPFAGDRDTSFRKAAPSMTLSLLYQSPLGGQSPNGYDF
jgi:hypothetical protein